MAAAGLIKNLRVTKTGSGSSSLAEAQQRATDFFREACRALPSIMDRYNLYDVITLSDLRSKIGVSEAPPQH
jgi:NADH dehydrogenase (ubiquinone) 1 alpha subcomplex subunit 6